MSYLDNLRDAAAAAAVQLHARCGATLRFGGEGEIPARTPTVPTDARSEFLANRAMGDWAEHLLAEALRRHWGVAHYGAADTIHAGEPGFREFYLAQHDVVRREGKRPDLLVFDRQADAPTSMTALAPAEQARFVGCARASIEVRSSKFRALDYIAEKQRRRADGQRAAGRDAPSFTVKLEDLVILYRWIERHRLPQCYFQVFFDSVFAIGVLEIFGLIEAWPRGLTLVKPDNSQHKPTVLVPITFGHRVGTMAEPPRFEARVRETALGRIDAYIVPIGGVIELDRAAAEAELFRH